jgi:hypothetical protein
MFYFYTVYKKMNFCCYDKFDVELITEYTPQFIQYIIDICEPYSKYGKDKKDLYAPERIKHCFYSGRFRYGFCIVKYDKEIVATVGIDDFNGWASMSRYLRHARTGVLEPIFLGVCVTFAIDQFNNKVKGVCWTQNFDKRDLVGLLLQRFAKPQNDQKLYVMAANVVSKTIRIKNPVFYRGVEQEGFYIPFKNELPPFDIIKRP